MTDATRADVCVIACAELFRGDGEIVASPMGTVPRLGALVARATFEPDLLLSDGEATLLDGSPALGDEASAAVEGWLPFRSVFEVLASGRRHVIMGASQIDAHGNQNISCIGDHAAPKVQLLGARGAPGNTVNHATSYWVSAHSPKVFVERVDFVSGVGTDRAAAEPEAARFHDLRGIVTDLGVFDLRGPGGTVRLVSTHPGVAVDEVRAATGFELAMADYISETRRPTAEERDLIARLDPRGLRDTRGPRTCSDDLMAPPPTSGPPPLRTAFTDLVGVRYPVVQTGMGWVAGPRLVAATAEAGGLGILAAATMTFDEFVAAVAEVKQRTEQPFGVNLRADQDDVTRRIDVLITERVRVASFALAPKAELVARLREAGVVVMPSIGARRHAEKVAAWGVDAVLAQGGEGGGHTGGVPTTLLLPQVVDAVDVPVVAAGGFFDGRGLVAALAYGASAVAMGTRFLLTQESTVPDEVKRFYLDHGVDGTVRTTRVDGVPHRVLRTSLIDELESAGTVRGFLRATANAARFKRLSGTSWSAMLREGRAMRATHELSWGQVVMAANTPILLRAAMVEGRTDLGVMSAGQVVGVIDDLPTVAEVIHRIVTEAHEVLASLTPRGDGPPRR